MSNLHGRKFGKWTAFEYSRHQNRPAWVCECECGTKRSVRQSFLLNGSSTSCGCKRKESITNVLGKHQLKSHPLYSVWKSMKERCRNENNPAFRNYGGRGISVSSEWSEFIDFYNWSMKNGYARGLEIDRIHNNGNYEPNNCRFVTSKKNGNNRRTNLVITIGGISKTLSEWSDVSGINRMTISSRLKKLGWGESELLNPVRKGVV